MSDKTRVPDARVPADPESLARLEVAQAGPYLDALLREIVRNGVPPDALMTPGDGPAYENLYRWWHERWAPTLQKVRAILNESEAPHD